MRLKNKSIIVTGSGGGIGEGIARRLAAEGASVIVNDINVAMGEAVAAAAPREGRGRQIIHRHLPHHGGKAETHQSHVMIKRQP